MKALDEQAHPQKAQPGGESDHESGPSVPQEFVADSQGPPPAPIHRTGTLREQFAGALQAHFATTLETLAAAATANLTIPSGCPRTDPFPSPASGRFRGVTKHKRTQRFEAHIWNAKKQLYLGGFDSEVLAAKSHDLMAIRVKGRDCDILNFPVDSYTDLTPLVERLPTDDIVIALRNYSKAQTAARGGGLPPADHAAATPVLALRSGGVQKPRPLRRPTHVPSGAPAVPPPLRRLKISTPPRRRRRAATVLSDEEEDDCVDWGEDEGWAARPRQFRRPAYTATEPALATTSSPSSPRLRRIKLAGAGAKLAPGFSLASPSPSPSPALPSTPQPAQPGMQDVLGVPALHRLPTLPELPIPAGSLSSGPASVAHLDSLDLNAVLTHLVPDEPSLTYSATDESYLFETVPMDGIHSALEHLSGAVLYTVPSSSSPESPTSALVPTVGDCMLWDVPAHGDAGPGMVVPPQEGAAPDVSPFAAAATTFPGMAFY